jgi:hypothetical protein
MFTVEFHKQASAVSELNSIMGSIYNENPEYWPHGLSKEHFDGGVYLIRKEASAEAVGFVGWQERLDGMDKIGYYSIGILPQYRRNGFAKQAVSQLLAQKSARVDKVRALIVDTNTPSRGLAGSLGVDQILKKVASISDPEPSLTKQALGASDDYGEYDRFPDIPRGYTDKPDSVGDVSVKPELRAKYIEVIKNLKSVMDRDGGNMTLQWDRYSDKDMENYDEMSVEEYLNALESGTKTTVPHTYLWNYGPQRVARNQSHRKLLADARKLYKGDVDGISGRGGRDPFDPFGDGRFEALWRPGAIKQFDKQKSKLEKDPSLQYVHEVPNKIWWPWQAIRPTHYTTSKELDAQFDAYEKAMDSIPDLEDPVYDDWEIPFRKLHKAMDRMP